MKSENDSRPLIYRLAGTLAAGLFYLAVSENFYERYQYMLRDPLATWSPSFFVITIFSLVLISFTLAGIWRPAFLVDLKVIRRRLGWTRWVVLTGAGVFTCWFFNFAPWSAIFSGFFTRILVYGVAITSMAWLAAEKDEHAFTWRGWLAALILFATAFAVTINFQFVNNNPFSLYWSEGNRLWDYSLLYGRDLYIYPAEKTYRAYTDLGRQSIWGLPFLLPRVSILGERIWSALMFTLPYFLLGLFVFTPQKERLREWLLLGCWTLVFLNQGPVYAPLVFAALLVAAAHKRSTWLALILTALAGYYARTSRITWTFAPAMWAVMVTLVDESSPFGRTMLQRWKRAIGLGLAGLSGFFMLDLFPPLRAMFQGMPYEASLVSVEGIQSAGSRQPLLWDRLLPNSTNALGILPGLIIAALPLIVLLIVYVRSDNWRFNLWQKLAIAGPLLAFLTVGIIVSVKIGGGSNLHNMDMLLLGLIFLAGVAWGRGGRDWLIAHKSGLLGWIVVMVILVITLPGLRDMMVVDPIQFPSSDKTEAALHSIQKSVAEAKEEGDVLFLDQRQLLTFGYVKDVELVPEYEKKRMMDQAMAENETYFKDFYHDLAEHRFTLIISEPLAIRWQGEAYNFGNENDAWVKWVTIPVLCNYQIEETFQEVGVQTLVPRERCRFQIPI